MRSLLPCSVLLLTTVACNRERAEAPTYTRDAAPILDSRCVTCHTPGGIAPFALETYEDAAALAPLIANSVEDRTMPPAQPNQDCNSYLGDPSLTEEERQILIDWADMGSLQGEAADAVETEPWANPTEMDRVDLEVDMPEPYTPQNAPDDYRCFVAEWPEEEDIYVTGLGISAGNPTMVHHVIVYAIPESRRQTFLDLDAAEEGPGYTCFGGPGGEVSDRPQWLGGWTPGQVGQNMPEGTGIEVSPGSLIIMEVHYYVGNNDNPDADLSSVLLRLDSTVDVEGATVPMSNPDWVLNGQMPIPAGSEMSYTTSTEVVKAARLHDVGMHMHTYGVSGHITLTDPDGEETCALQIDRWDFNWQRAYRLAEPIDLEPGTEISVTCDFVNNTDTDLNWGESTEAEMCLAVNYFSYPF